VSQEQLRHFIPWAREKWKDKPTLAVAFELALTFSISDLQYFVALCTQRWKSDRQGREGMIFDHLYKTHQLPKKSGGKRTITVPDERLKGLQRKILRNGFDELFVHPSAHGFKRGRSILTNATVHVQQTLVLNVDIKSFFPNTRYKHILRASSLLLDGQLSEGAKRIVADICSYNGGLPTGAPTSPAIANLVLRAADTAITKAAKKNGIVYSRYADDLTFSGESNTLKLLPFVKKVLAELGYELDPKKTNIFRRGRRQIVTGLVVNEKPNLPRRIRRKLRAAVHQMCNGGESRWHGRPMSKNELLGRLSMLHLVQPEEAKALKRKLAAHATL
jgi:RNA-directed DNA polymerase